VTFCQNCVTKSKSHEKFCSNCGNNLIKNQIHRGSSPSGYTAPQTTGTQIPPRFRKRTSNKLIIVLGIGAFVVFFVAPAAFIWIITSDFLVDTTTPVMNLKTHDSTLSGDQLILELTLVVNKDVILELATLENITISISQILDYKIPNGENLVTLTFSVSEGAISSGIYNVIIRYHEVGQPSLLFIFVVDV
jgi:hypothetical protein